MPIGKSNPDPVPANWKLAAKEVQELTHLGKLITPNFSWIGRKIFVEGNLSEGAHGLGRRIAAFFRKIGHLFSHRTLKWEGSASALNGMNKSIAELIKTHKVTLLSLPNKSVEGDAIDKAIADTRKALRFLDPTSALVNKNIALLTNLEDARKAKKTTKLDPLTPAPETPSTTLAHAHYEKAFGATFDEKEEGTVGAWIYDFFLMAEEGEVEEFKAMSQMLFESSVKDLEPHLHTKELLGNRLLMLRETENLLKTASDNLNDQKEEIGKEETIALRSEIATKQEIIRDFKESLLNNWKGKFDPRSVEAAPFFFIASESTEKGSFLWDIHQEAKGDERRVATGKWYEYWAPKIHWMLNVSSLVTNAARAYFPNDNAAISKFTADRFQTHKRRDTSVDDITSQWTPSLPPVKNEGPAITPPTVMEEPKIDASPSTIDPTGNFSPISKEPFSTTTGGVISPKPEIAVGSSPFNPMSFSNGTSPLQPLGHDPIDSNAMNMQLPVEKSSLQPALFTIIPTLSLLALKQIGDLTSSVVNFIPELPVEQQLELAQLEKNKALALLLQANEDEKTAKTRLELAQNKETDAHSKIRDLKEKAAKAKTQFGAAENEKAAAEAKLKVLREKEASLIQQADQATIALALAKVREEQATKERAVLAATTLQSHIRKAYAHDVLVEKKNAKADLDAIFAEEERIFQETIRLEREEALRQKSKLKPVEKEPFTHATTSSSAIRGLKAKNELEGKNAEQAQAEIEVIRENEEIGDAVNYLHSVKDVEAYAQGFADAGKLTQEEIMNDLITKINALQLIDVERREKLKEQAKSSIGTINDLIDGKCKQLKAEIASLFRGKVEIAHGVNKKSILQTKARIKQIEDEIVSEITEYVENIYKAIEGESKISLSDSLSESLSGSGLSNSWIAVAKEANISDLNASWVDLIAYGQTKDVIGMGPLQKDQIRAHFNTARIKKVLEHPLWTKGWSSKPIQFAKSGDMVSSFMPAFEGGIAGAYPSTAPRNRKADKAVLPNFFNTTFKPTDTSKPSVIPHFNATRSATAIEFDLKDDAARAATNRELVKQVLTFHAKEYLAQQANDPFAIPEKRVPFQWVALFTDSSLVEAGARLGGHYFGIHDADNETQLLRETQEALKYFNENPIEVNGKKVQFDIQLWNTPCNKIQEVISNRISKSAGTCESSCNGDAQSKMSRDIAKKVNEIKSEIAQCKVPQELIQTVEELQKEKSKSLGNREQWTIAANALASITRMEGKVAEETKYLRLVQQMECILDLQRDIEEIIAKNLVADLPQLDYNRHALSARLLNMGSFLGYARHFNCRSGKDRTYQADLEAKLFAIVADCLGRCPAYWEQEDLDFKKEYRQLLVDHSGNVDVIPTANLGSNLGANTTNCHNFPRGKNEYSSDEEYQKAADADMRKISGAAKELFVRKN